jgi:hypothetical protein
LWKSGFGQSYSVLGLNEGVVDSNNVDVVVLDAVVAVSLQAPNFFMRSRFNLRIAEDNATNATEAVNTNLRNG